MQGQDADEETVRGGACGGEKESSNGRGQAGTTSDEEQERRGRIGLWCVEVHGTAGVAGSAVVGGRRGVGSSAVLMVVLVVVVDWIYYLLAGKTAYLDKERYGTGVDEEDAAVQACREEQRAMGSGQWAATAPERTRK
ncbi:hypothetical protein EG329_008537 [Mollisiaceae sp. DMI_Dod_QoI]|nr:hypothetical protein EG329_008537 [Helotiales sp. DMI_Dod_QoI]